MGKENRRKGHSIKGIFCLVGNYLTYSPRETGVLRGRVKTETNCCKFHK
jgi:hypothetical protein